MPTKNATATSIDGMSGEAATEKLAIVGALSPDSFLRAMEQADADLAGLPVEECAGFELLSWVPHGPDTASFVLLTRGYGPRPEDNVHVTGMVRMDTELWVPDEREQEYTPYVGVPHPGE